MTTRVLLVEDEPALARGLVDNFRDEGYEVRVEVRGDRALAAVRESRPDLVVLDVMLPGRSGLDVLRDLRSAGDTVPVLVLTAKGDVVDRVVGLELGADDYMPKPFAVRELLARVRALLRRAAPKQAPDELTLGVACASTSGLSPPRLPSERGSVGAIPPRNRPPIGSNRASTIPPGRKAPAALARKARPARSCVPCLQAFRTSGTGRRRA